MPTNPHAERIGRGKSLKATYDVAYVQHAPMEPRAAVAEWDGRQADRLDRHAGPVRACAASSPTRSTSPRQGPRDRPRLRRRLRRQAHRRDAPSKRRGSRKAAGKPVALRWTRAEEFTWAYFRPAAAIEVEAALDDDGKLATWHFVNVNSGRSGIETPYRVGEEARAVRRRGRPAAAARLVPRAGVDGQHLRPRVLHGRAGGRSPAPTRSTFRLAHLDEPRLRDVLEDGRRRSSTGRRRRKRKHADGIGVGLACGTEKGSFVAACAEVARRSRRRATIKVLRVCQAYECGKITSPANLRRRSKAAIVMGLGPALREAMLFEDGKIAERVVLGVRGAADRRTCRSSTSTCSTARTCRRVGAGETPIIAVAPAIANAVFHATAASASARCR